LSGPSVRDDLGL